MELSGCPISYVRYLDLGIYLVLSQNFFEIKWISIRVTVARDNFGFGLFRLTGF